MILAHLQSLPHLHAADAALVAILMIAMGFTAYLIGDKE